MNINQEFKAKLAQIIRMLVKEEIKKERDAIISEITTSIMAKLLVEAMGSKQIAAPSSRLNEVSMNTKEELDEYPTAPVKVFDRSTLAAAMGYGEIGAIGDPRANNVTNNKLNLPSGMMSDIMGDSAGPQPVDPSQVPDVVVKAMNKNYSEFMKKVDSKRR